MLPVNYNARSTQRELDKLKREVDRVDALAVGPTGPAGPTGPQGSVGLQGPAGLGAVDVLDEDDMISNADNKVATQQSIKAYVDSKQDLVFKPSDYGAVGDNGTTDDIIAIKAMIVDVKANGGGTVDLEEKVYGVSETVAFGVPIRLLCGKKAGFKAKNSISTFSEITGRGGDTQPVDPEDPDGPKYRVLFDIKGMAYSSFEGLFELSSVGGTSAMGGQVNYVPNLIAITQQDGTGPIQALNGYFENLYVTKLHAAFFQPEKDFLPTPKGPVLPYTRTWFARLEIVKCYQAWNFLHVNGFDDCAVGILRVNKCAEDAYAKAFDLNCVEAFLAGGKATEDDTFSTTASSNAFTTSTTGVVSVGDRVLVKGAETYGQGFCTKIATYSGTSGTFEDVCPVTTTNAEFIFAAGGFLMDRATFVCNKLYLEGAYHKLLHFTRQGTLGANTLKFSTGEFGCYKGRPIVFEHISSNCIIGSVPAGEQGVNGNPLVDIGLGKLIKSYIYYGLREYTDLQIPPQEVSGEEPDETNTFDFYPDHFCTINLMMTKDNFETYGINPIEVGHTIYDPTGFAGGIRELTTSNSQLTVNYSNASVKVSGDIGGNELIISGKTSVIPLSAFGGSPTATATVNTAAMEKAWLQLKDKGGKILLDEAGDWNFNNSVFARTSKPIEIEAVDGVEIFPALPAATTWMWDFQSDTGISQITEVNFTNVRVSGQNSDDSRKEFLGIRVGRSNNLTAYKCFGRFVNGTAWHFVRPHNSEIDVTTFNSGKNNATHANRFAMMITGAYETGINQVFNDVRLSGTSEKDYYGWVVEGGTLLRTTSQLKIHGADYAQRGFQLHRVADFDVQLNMSQQYNGNGFVHFSDAPALQGGSSTDGVTLFVGQDTGSGGLASTLPIRGTVHLSNLTNAEVVPTAPNSTVDLFVLNISAASSSVECTGMLIPQKSDGIPLNTVDLVEGRQYRISSLGSGTPEEIETAWNLYLGTQTSSPTGGPLDYKIGDFFTAPASTATKPGSGIVTRRYAMIGLTGLSNKFNFPKIGKVSYSASVVDQLVRDSRSMTTNTSNNQKILQNDISPAIGGAVMEKLQTEGTSEPQTPRFEITRLECVRLSNTVVKMNRRGTLGTILELQRGNAEVGQVGVEYDFNTNFEGLYVEGTGSGLSFENGAIVPRANNAKTDKTIKLGTTANSFKEIAMGDIQMFTGAGTPESIVYGNQGSMYLRTDGTSTTTLYVKTTSNSNTGWVAR